MRRYRRVLSAIGAILRCDVDLKITIDSENADFLKFMLSLRREHRFSGPEGPKMEPRTHPKCSFEAKGAKEERKSAQDDPRSAPEATFATHPARFGLSKKGVGGRINPPQDWGLGLVLVY